MQNPYRHLQLLRVFASSPTEAVPDFLRTSQRGLTDLEAKRRLHQNGPNVIPRAGSETAAKLFAKAIWNPFNLLVSTLALISYATGQVSAAILMASMVILSVAITF